MRLGLTCVLMLCHILPIFHNQPQGSLEGETCSLSVVMQSIIFWSFLHYAPISGLPQDGGAGQPTGIRLRKVHVGGDFDIHNGPQGGKFDSTAILKSGEDLGMSEWSAILENTQKSFERVSCIQGWLDER